MLFLIVGPLVYILLPRGEKIGTVDLLSDDPTLEVTLKAGTRLMFRLDVEPGTKSVARLLRDSTLLVELVDGASTEKATCPAYEGKAISGLSGIVLSCELRIERSVARAFALGGPGLAAWCRSAPSSRCGRTGASKGTSFTRAGVPEHPRG